MMCRIESVFAHSPTTLLPPESNTTFFKSVNHIITSKPLLTNLILSESRPHSEKQVDWSAHFDDEVLWITIMTMWDWIEFDTANFLLQYTMLCNPVYIIKQFITSKPTSLDVIGFSIASLCLTSTKAMPSESRPRRLCLRTWFIGFLVSKLYGAVNSILRYLIFWNYQFFSSAWVRSALWPPLIIGPGDFFTDYHQSQIINGELFFVQSFLLISHSHLLVSY